MKLDPNPFAAACAFVTAILWIVCALAVAALPGPMMNMTGHMMHTDVTEFRWALNWLSFFVGLVSWTAIAGVAGWLIAVIYNRLLKQTPSA